MKVESVAISSLMPDPSNVRKHSPKNLAAIKGSLAKFGQQKPIVVGKNNIVIAGNGTLEAATALGWDSIDIVRTSLTGTEATAFAIADNRTGELAEWDAGGLSDTLKALQDMDFDLDSIGFDPDDLEAMIASSEEPTVGLTDPDEIPENVETRCKPGDLWILGNHRLLCGDSTNVQHVDRLMDGEKADMVFTDPPYGIAYQGGSKKRDAIANDNTDVLSFYREFLTLAKAVSKPGAAIYIWHASTETHNCIVAAIESGWLYKQYLVWVKNNSTFGSSDYHWQHEPCFYGWGSDGSHRWHGDRKQTTTWMIDRPSKSDEHPTMKPVGLCERGIHNSSTLNGLIYEPFLGSGSTLIACEKTGRKCYGMEIDPNYCDVILKRWEDFTGKTAELSAVNAEGK